MVATENECRELGQLTQLRGDVCEPVATQVQERQSTEEREYVMDKKNTLNSDRQPLFVTFQLDYAVQSRVYNTLDTLHVLYCRAGENSR